MGTHKQSSAANDRRLNIAPVILAGGQGLRLRPLTGSMRPKPFLKPFSEQSLLQQTALRASGFAPPVICCYRDYGIKALQALAEIKIKPRAVICEPAHKNTAAAIAAAAFTLEDTDMMMAVMPSDHYIEDTKAFQQALLQAKKNAGADEIAILGVKPKAPETRYGYIKTGQPGFFGAADIEHFVEKPSQSKAKALFEDEKCFWNTGVFLVRPRYFLTVLKQSAPDVYNAVYQAHAQRTLAGPFVYLNAAAYERGPSISVDYAVMEHVKSAKLIELKTDWHDIGCWPALLRVKIEAVRSRLLKSGDHEFRRAEQKAGY